MGRNARTTLATEESRQLQETLGDIKRLLEPGDVDGDDRGALPAIETGAYASSWISQFHAEVARAGEAWLKPHVVANPDGEIVFTWWHGRRMLTVYVAGGKAEYLESWGTSIHGEMADGDADSPSVYRFLWSRLLRG